MSGVRVLFRAGSYVDSPHFGHQVGGAVWQACCVGASLLAPAVGGAAARLGTLPRPPSLGSVPRGLLGQGTSRGRLQAQAGLRGSGGSEQLAHLQRRRPVAGRATTPRRGPRPPVARSASPASSEPAEPSAGPPRGVARAVRAPPAARQMRRPAAGRRQRQVAALAQLAKHLRIAAPAPPALRPARIACQQTVPLLRAAKAAGSLLGVQPGVGTSRSKCRASLPAGTG